MLVLLTPGTLGKVPVFIFFVKNFLHFFILYLMSGVHVEGSGQLAEVGSLLPPSGFQGLNTDLRLFNPCRQVPSATESLQPSFWSLENDNIPPFWSLENDNI